jgi:hypothetical protein
MGTVDERTACDRLVARLVRQGEPTGFCGRLRLGLSLLRQAYEGTLSGKAARRRPVDGIKKSLVAHGQAGQFYRHLQFHIGCRFLGWPGRLASWFMHRVDRRQAAKGRMESAVEVKGNEAAFACADVLMDRSRRRISRAEAAARLRDILGA